MIERYGQPKQKSETFHFLFILRLKDLKRDAVGIKHLEYRKNMAKLKKMCIEKNVDFGSIRCYQYERRDARSRYVRKGFVEFRYSFTLNSNLIR